MSLSGKVAIVTGAARGIGAGIARCLAEQGARVGIIDLDAAQAEETARSLPGEAFAISADAAEERAVAEAVDRCVERSGRLDLMVNNAGGGRGPLDLDQLATLPPVPPFTNLTQERWDEQLANNLRSTFAGCKAAIPHLKASGGGAIVNIASIAGLIPAVGLPAYGAAKAGVIHLTKSLALELAPDRIRVNAICPGFLYTRAWEGLATLYRRHPELANLEAREIFLSMVKQHVPMGREQTPEDVGHLVAFLASDAACNITGQEIKVDGGITLKVGGI